MSISYSEVFRNVGSILRSINLFANMAEATSDAPVAKVISGATQANPGVITATAHGFKSGDRILITEVTGMVELNGFVWIVEVVNANTFRIWNTQGSGLPAAAQDTSGYTAYSAGGVAIRVGVNDLEEMLSWVYETMNQGSNSEILTEGVGSLYTGLKDSVTGMVNGLATHIDLILDDPETVREQLLGLSSSAGFEEVLQELYDDMVDNSESVYPNTVTLGSVTTVVGVGNGTVLVDKVLDGVTPPHPGFAANEGYVGLDSQLSVTETMSLTCVQDEDSDGTPQGEEVFLWEGRPAQTDPFDWRTAGSGVSETVPSLASYSIIANGNFEAFDDNIPESWDLDSGVAGTNVVQEGTGADVYRGSYALRFDNPTGDTVATIKISQTIPIGSIVPNKRYCLACRVKATAGIAAGSLTIQFESPSGGYTAGSTERVLMNSAALAAQNTYDLEYFYFNIPAKVPSDMELVIKVTGTLTADESVWVDSLMFGPVSYGNGVNVVVIPGSDQFVRKDRFSFTVTNNQAGKFQEFFRKRYKVMLPSNTTPTIKEAWAG